MTTHRSFLSSAFLLALSVTACSVASTPDTPEGAAEDGPLASSRSAVGPTGPVAGPGVILDPIDPDSPGPFVPNGPVKPHSFVARATWATSMTYAGGWREEHLRQVADMDGDGKKDIIGFGVDGVWIGRSTGSAFDVQRVLSDFGEAQGWSATNHERLLGDINADGKADIVGFKDAGVYISTGTTTGVSPVSFVLSAFGYNQGWRPNSHVRVLADVDGDGKRDIVGYGDDGVWVSRSTGTGFATAARVLTQFGNGAGFDNYKNIRTAADVNGDGKADLVVFGDDGVYTALSTGSGFAAPTKVLSAFGGNDGWSSVVHPRLLVDVNRDGRKDIVAFGETGVWIARSNGTGFNAPALEVTQFGIAQGFKSKNPNPRYVGDFNGDGYVDIVGSGPMGVWRSLGNAAGFSPAELVLNDYSNFDGLGGGAKAVVAGDFNGDGSLDLVGFDTATVIVARSVQTAAPTAIPAAPSNVRLVSSTTTTLDIAWNDNTASESRYRVVMRKPSPATDFVRRFDANTTSGLFQGLTPSTRYCFTVFADGPYKSSAPSPEACFSTKAEPTNPDPPTDPTVETVCGIGLGVCRAGYHEEEFTVLSSCGAGNPNAMKCVKDSASFTACGVRSCPSTHHATSFLYRPGCDQSTNVPTTADNASTCAANTGSTFTACGLCPAGYTRTASNPGSPSSPCWPEPAATCVRQ